MYFYFHLQEWFYLFLPKNVYLCEKVQRMKLADIATYVNDKIKSSNIRLEQYVTTDSLLQNKMGREFAKNLPPIVTNLTQYRSGDVLVANIRPYLKKIWFANCDGGASSDVLVFRSKNPNDTTFVYAILMQDAFYEYVMKGTKGSKMPRGDKDQIMRYEFPTLSSNQRRNIGKFIVDIDSKITINRAINDNLLILDHSLIKVKVRLAA